jgi:hypothetical protein
VGLQNLQSGMPVVFPPINDLQTVRTTLPKGRPSTHQPIVLHVDSAGNAENGSLLRRLARLGQQTGLLYPVAEALRP